MIFEIVGWLGGALAVSAYAMVTRFGTSATYHLLNLLGASGLLANALIHRAVPLLALNIVWCSISIWGMRAVSRRRQSVG